MTQNQLAERSGLGLGGLADLEAGRVPATDNDVRAIAAALGIERTTLLNRLPDDLNLTDMSGLLELYKHLKP